MMNVYKQVEFTNGWPNIVRYSHVIMALELAKTRATYGDGLQDSQRLIDMLQKLYTDFGNKCETHGPLPDPILIKANVDGIIGEQILFCCPYCSDETLRKRWEDEEKQLL